jgi:hypothetical protein
MRRNPFEPQRLPTSGKYGQASDAEKAAGSVHGNAFLKKAVIHE